MEKTDRPDVSPCEICGEPMPPGEEMFRYHGYSGPCPTQSASALESAAETDAPATLREKPDVWFCSGCHIIYDHHPHKVITNAALTGEEGAVIECPGPVRPARWLREEKP